MTLRVLDPGLYTLLVDFGRPASRSLGVPVGGAADRSSLALGNALVGNVPDAPALEITLAGPTLQASCELACVVYGAPFTMHTDQRELHAGVTFTLRPDEEIRITGTRKMMRAYLCLAGGFTGASVLGSQSGLGPLRAGDVLHCAPGRIGGRFLHTDWLQGRERRDEPQVLRVLVGAQADWFDVAEFYPQEFRVSPASNRMGLRLQGSPLKLPMRELISEPVCPGSVQVTRDGQCVILGVDGQTIGGYPKVAQVITADLDRLGQLRPGDSVRFVRVALEDAESRYRKQQAELGALLVRLQTAEWFRPPPVAPRVETH